MITFTIVSTVVDDNNLELLGVSDLEFVSIGGEDFLFVASEADGSITSFNISENLTPQLVDTVSFDASSGTLAVGQLDITEVNGVLTLLPSARFDDDVATYLIDGSGNLSTPVSQPPNGNSVSNFVTAHTVIVAGKTFLFAVERGAPGIAAYWMQPGDSFSAEVIYPDTGFDYFGDIAAFASVVIGAQTFLFAASAFDAGINSFSIANDGALQFADSVASSDGSGFSLPQVLETVVVGAQTYLLMASAGSDSITVYAVGSGGVLTETDHMIDTVDTRFNDASVLESFTHNGRSFLLAAGSDDGITLLEISSTGTLSFLAVLADDFNTTLNNITDVEVVEFGTEIHAFVSSGSENGFTQILIDLDSIGQNIIGTAADETLTGSAFDDTLSGLDGSDRLFGGDGDDLLIGGNGRDHFYGGIGIDVFEFLEDGTRDLIRDYETGVDLIDLSSISGASGMNDVTIQGRSFGAIIQASGEEIWVFTVDGNGLDINDFTASDFIF